LYEIAYIGFLPQIAVFMHESSYCFQRILAIAVLSVRPSVTQVD